MSEKSTLIVLGAGAHAPYFLPTGGELVDDIIDNFPRLLLNHPNFKSSRNCPHQDYIYEFVDKLKKSEFSTIDRWIASNPKYENVAKIAITLILTEKLKRPAELRKYLKTPPTKFVNGHRTILNSRGGNWFAVFFNKLTNGLYNTESLKSLFMKRVQIVTFNYEHFFEYLFYHNLVNSYTELIQPRYQSLLQDLCDKFAPTHINGSISNVRPFEYHSPNDSLYSFDTYDSLETGSSAIYTLGQNSAPDDFSLIEDWDRVYFLGFGYDVVNLKRINYDKPNEGSKIYGTAFQSTELEIQEITELLRNKTKETTIHIENKDSYLLLRERLVL